MEQLLRDALVGGIENVFFQLTDLVAERYLVSEGADGDPLKHTWMHVGGTFPGYLHLVASTALCQKVLAIIIPEEATSDDIERDVLCELLNMVAESARTLMLQGGARFEVNVPMPCEVASDMLPEWAQWVEIPVLGERVAVWLQAGEQPHRQVLANPVLERLLEQD